MFSEVRVDSKDLIFILHQTPYSIQLWRVSLDCVIENFRAEWYEVVWLNRTITDLCVTVAILRQTTKSGLIVKAVRLLNETISCTQSYEGKETMK